MFARQLHDPKFLVCEENFSHQVRSLIWIIPRIQTVPATSWSGRLAPLNRPGNDQPGFCFFVLGLGCFRLLLTHLATVL